MSDVRGSARAEGRGRASQGRGTGSSGGSGRPSPSGTSEDPGFAYGRGRRGLSDDDERVVRRYYPIFENLILFILNSGRWVRNFRTFFREETRYRGRLLFQGLAFLTVSLAFLFGASLMLVAGFFFLFRDLTGSAWAAAFLNGLVALLLSVFLFSLLLGALRKIGSLSRYQAEEAGSPGSRRRRAARREEK